MMKNQEFDSESFEDGCMFCDEQDDPTSLCMMLTQALYSKHLSKNNTNYVNPIDIILKVQEPTNSNQVMQYVNFKEFGFLDQQDESLKRVYFQNEFDGKIKMLSEYYKFHKDIPRIIQPRIQRILGKYYDHKREFDYKCIKKLLKQQQGLSITSVEDSMSEISEDATLKSRYSTILDALKDTEEKQQQKLSDSKMLQEICKEIGNALPQMKVEQRDFKGLFFKSEKNFDDYIKRQKNYKKIDTNPKRKKPKVDMVTKYFAIPKNKKSFDEQTKQKNQTRMKDRSDDKKKKFIYNTNIKIEIQNALFYPDSQNYQFVQQKGQGQTSVNRFSKSKKSIIGKVAAINDERYRTPVTKIYQAKEGDFLKYKNQKKFTNSRQRLKTKEKQSKNLQRQKEFTRKVMSSGSLRKISLDTQSPNRYRPINIHQTCSVGRLRGETLKVDSGAKVTQPTRNASAQVLRRRSVTLTRNSNQNSAEKTPLAKYASSQMKDKRKIKGVSIKDLLTKKLNIYER